MATDDLIPPDLTAPVPPLRSATGPPTTMPMPGQTGGAINGLPMRKDGGGGFFDANPPPAAAPNPLQGSLSQGSNMGNAPGGGYFNQFVAPNLNDTNDPGYRFRLDEGARQFQNSAFARGQGLTGGQLRDAMNYNQNAASAEYSNVFNRALAGDTFNRDTAFGNTDRALQSYMASRDTLWGDTDRLFNRNFSVASLGQNAAGGYGNSLGAFGVNGANLITGGGNAGAAGTIGVGNAVSGGVRGIPTAVSQYRTGY